MYGTNSFVIDRVVFLFFSLLPFSLLKVVVGKRVSLSAMNLNFIAGITPVIG